MAALGLLLLAAAGVFGLVVALSNAGTDHVARGTEIFGYTTTMSTGRLFLIGIVTGIAGTLGLALMLGKLGRSAKQHRQRKATRHQLADTEALVVERDRLAAELQQERASHTGAARPVAPAGDSAVYPDAPGEPAPTQEHRH